ncbi:hypothetical protein LOTGIDRAFT_159848 [Lottia gigantea]|uniref:Bromodomain adjacent to zinc finger domain protein 1A n=1 Tax=Lottia gigantea TaxID=225164 RepID=V3ZY40_LOTGI|nr:hypothetical protein LOTGIDRAFT_159848 [Lottia gigantea]ESO96438.1 hypothetical protein LOTGIDRAFT_159848 [Lottia gigantea]
MPLLRKQPFLREQPSPDLTPDSEVFFCRITKEIFTDYESFFERIILCNSLVWSCAITGKSGLTYQEAVECEEKAKKNLSSFPSCIQKPILYLATKTHRTRLNDLNDDIFGFVKERFFLGEVVDVVINDVRRTCEVIKIIPPPGEAKNGDVIVIDDDEEESVKPPALQEPAKYKYVVKEKKGGAMSTVRCSVISRKNRVYTRDKNKLYLKLHCEPVDGVWKVKDESKLKFKLNSCKFDQFYAGPMPTFEVSSQKKKPASKKSDGKPGTEGSASKKSKTKDKKPDPAKHNPFIPDYGVDQETLLKMTTEERAAQREKVKQERLEERERKKEEIRKRNEEIRNKKREEKAKEREELRKEKFKQLEILREYNRIREDIELDDLKIMPEFTPVSTRLPSELFGETMHVLEFTHCFKTMFDFKQFFPKGFTYGMLESAILDNDTDGPLCDLLQMLLVAIFTLQEEEAEEVAELETESSIRDDDQDESLTNQLIEQATMIAQTPQQVHGLPLKKMLLDQFTLSEILRLHLMSAGCKTTIRNARFRYQQRGGYTSQDDAGLDFKITDMNLLKSLNSKNVYDLQPEDKLKIISVLLQQILSYAAIRDLIDESFDKIRTLKYDLKQLQWAEQRREREDAAARYKKQQEDKMKERMKKMKLLMEQNPKANIEGAVKDQNENKMEVDEEEEEELTAEEKEAQERKYQEKEVKKKLEFARKEEDFMTEIMELQQNIATYPLGRDRMFRRYWLFKSMNGIFVEDNSLFVDEEKLFCYESQTPVCDTDKNNTSSDKENDLYPDDKGDNCIVISDDESRSNDGKEQFIKIPDTPAILQIKERVKYSWSFVSPGCLDQLLNVLNPRGFRESSLKQTITEIKPLVVNSLDRCETEELCQSGVDTEEARIKALALTRGIASKKAAQDTLKRDSADVDLELNLRDAILDIEDRMFVGALGYLKVEDRGVWRSKIESNASGNLANGGNSGDAPLENEKDSVKELSQALFEISEGIDHRYLQLPLKESDGKKKGGKGDKKKKKKEEEIKDGDDSDDNKEEEKKKITTFDKWQESLKHVTSLSQVYLYLSTFEKSVMWDKSALHARCRLCRKKGDAERMLLCDGCDRGHHMDCLKPPIKKVPVGDWYCPNCRPKEVIIRSPRKGRRRTFTDDEEVEEEGSSQEEEAEEEEEEEEDACSEVDEESEAEEEEEEEADESMEDDNENTCSVCNTPGMLICCDCCPKSYHLACAIPALKKIPRGKWLCQECLGINKVGKVKFGQKQKAKRSSKSNLAVLARNSPKHSPASTPRSSTKGESDDDTPVRSAKSRRTTPRTTEKEDNSAKKSKSGSRGNAKIQHLKMAEELIADLVKHDDAWPFLKPVNRREVPDYYDVIKEPMDFQTIKNKIHKFEYRDPNQIVEDVKLIFFNCVEYNNRNTPQYKSGTILNKYFQKRVKELALDVDDYVPPPSKKSRH